MLIASFTLARSAHAAPDEDGVEVLTEDANYFNSRAGFQLTIPARFGRMTQSMNGDGFHAGPDDGSFLLRAWGCDNAEMCDFEGDWTRSSKVATYKVKKDDWYVASGVTGGRVFYEKEMKRGGVTATFRLEFPEVRKKEFDPVIAQLVKSFAFASGTRVERTQPSPASTTQSAPAAASAGLKNEVSRWQGSFAQESDPKYLHTVTLTVTDSAISGSYFYARSKKPIELKGSRAGNAFIVDELNGGRVVATFKGSVDAAGTSASGSWVMSDGSKKLTFKWTREP